MGSSLLARWVVAEFVHNGHVTLQAVVWKPTAEETAAAANDPQYRQLVCQTFSTTAREVIDRLIARQGGSISRAYVQLKQWSPVELKQPLKDELGREIFTWRVPLEQCECANKGEMQGIDVAACC